MPIQSQQDLFLFDLSTLYSADQTILQDVTQMERETQDPKAKQQLAEIATQIRQHLNRHEECFRMLGKQPIDVPCQVAEGFAGDRQLFLQQNPSTGLIDLYNMGLSIKIGHYKVGFYRTLLESARALGNAGCSSALEDNLREAEAAIQQTEQVESSIQQKAA